MPINRQITKLHFGWFGGWSGEGAYMKSSLAGIPDSVDIVSIWGNWSNITEAQKKIWNFANKLKVLVLPCVLLSEV